VQLRDELHLPIDRTSIAASSPNALVLIDDCYATRTAPYRFDGVRRATATARARMAFR